MTMTDERLAKLDAVMAKATAGEWEWRNDQLLPLSDQWTISPGVLIADSNNGTPGGDEIDRANAAAIVALHNAYPDLRAHIDAQDATIVRLREALQVIVDDYQTSPKHHPNDILIPIASFGLARAALTGAA